MERAQEACNAVAHHTVRFNRYTAASTMDSGAGHTHVRDARVTRLGPRRHPAEAHGQRNGEEGGDCQGHGRQGHPALQSDDAYENLNKMHFFQHGMLIFLSIEAAAGADHRGVVAGWWGCWL